MIKELKLKPGISVADIGSGNGYHTLMMAKIIGEKGQAYAVDIQPEMLIMLEERAKKAGMENIKLIENRFWDADLPEKSVDFVLMAVSSPSQVARKNVNAARSSTRCLCQ